MASDPAPAKPQNRLPLWCVYIALFPITEGSKELATQLGYPPKGDSHAVRLAIIAVGSAAGTLVWGSVLIGIIRLVRRLR